MSQPASATIEEADLTFIREAVEYLENPSFLMKAANLLGKPVESLGQLLPERVRETAASVVDNALTKALEVALVTLPSKTGQQLHGVVDLDAVASEGRWDRMKHNLAAGMTGAVAGTFGVKALAIELPVTTTIMMRDIAAVAMSYGEDASDQSVKLQCLAVFSIGGAAGEEGKSQSAMESTYYASRVALANLMREAVQYVTRLSAEQLARDLSSGASPVLVRLIAQVASRFNLVVNQKLVAQAVPAIGAVGGALVNVAFNAHFDRVARYHFGIRALERRYGNDAVQAAYHAALRRAKQ
jgi:hypothetical protein